jgi:hypothetical protein
LQAFPWLDVILLEIVELVAAHIDRRHKKASRPKALAIEAGAGALGRDAGADRSRRICDRRQAFQFVLPETANMEDFLGRQRLVLAAVRNLVFQLPVVLLVAIRGALVDLKRMQHDEPASDETLFGIGIAAGQ